MKEQRRVLDAVRTGRNGFFTGSASESLFSFNSRES
jgi:hypothetical protein